MQTLDENASQADSRPGLLLVDDDPSHCSALQRAFERRGYAVKAANSVPQALTVLNDWSAAYAVIDLRLPGPSGLALIPSLKVANPGARIVMMSGYASIATAVEAIKLGAVNYLTKPVDVDMIERAFHRIRGDESALPGDQLSVDRVEWEHIQRALADCGGNISATARALHMHRRTLQRKLAKHPVRS